VLACAVVAKPDVKWGESPLAFVEVKSGANITQADLIAHCKSLLAGYKVPKEIRFEEITKNIYWKNSKIPIT
jgi:fatty-acyl-CoA synthase